MHRVFMSCRAILSSEFVMILNIIFKFNFKIDALRCIYEGDEYRNAKRFAKFNVVESPLILRFCKRLRAQGAMHMAQGT